MVTIAIAPPSRFYRVFGEKRIRGSAFTLLELERPLPLCCAVEYCLRRRLWGRDLEWALKLVSLEVLLTLRQNYVPCFWHRRDMVERALYPLGLLSSPTWRQTTQEDLESIFPYPGPLSDATIAVYVPVHRWAACWPSRRFCRFVGWFPESSLPFVRTVPMHLLN